MKKVKFDLVIFMFVLASTAMTQHEFPTTDNQTIPSEQLIEFNLPLPAISSYFDEAMLDSFIISTMSQHSIPGLATCIVKDGQVVRHHNYGYSNFSQNLPVNDSTNFIICSISKMITATALMQLWEQGLFQLDDNINIYLPPELQVHNPHHLLDSITFEMLLTHTSSIADNWNMIIEYPGDSPVSLDSFLINYLVPGGSFYYQNLNFFTYQPGISFNYSNVGFGLLGYLVERISGIPFPQYCQQNIFDPLDMNNSSWFLAGTDTSNIAMPHQGYSPVSHWSIAVYPAATLRTSVLQLANFLTAYMQKGSFSGNDILDSTTVNLMLNRQIFSTTYGYYWGLAWFHTNSYQNSHGPWLWGHTGSGIGARTLMFFHPVENWGYIVFVNTSLQNVTPLGSEISYFAYLWDKIYACRTNLYPESNYIKPNLDSLLVNSRFVNHNNQPFNSHAIFISTDSTFLDSVQLFDDGLHGDGGAGDSLWGNYMLPISVENNVSLRISTDNLNTGEYFITEAVDSFSTIGPVVFDSLIAYDRYKLGPFYRIPFEIVVRNNGSTTTAKDVRVYISTSHPRVSGIDNNSQNYSNIPAGQSVISPDSFILRLQNPEPIENIALHIDFYSNDILYWQDSTDIVVGIAKFVSTVPLEFAFHQNYPNPFNPTTTIEFDLPKSSEVTLKIYNILGEEVVTLVSDRLSAGSYSYEWDASGLASGVYLYRLEIAEFFQTRKMILMK